MSEDARTLGERLAAQGRAIAARHVPSFSWAGPLAVATGRATVLGATHEDRFTRVEVGPYDRLDRPDRRVSPRAAAHPHPGVPPAAPLSWPAPLSPAHAPVERAPRIPTDR